MRGDKLNHRQQVFISEYLKCFNGSEAARRAGYAAKNTRNVAYELMNQPKVKAEIEARLREVHMGADEALKLVADMARGEAPTKRVQTTTADGTSTTETFEKLEALDKILKVHGRYQQNVDLTSGGEPLTVKIIKGVTMDEI